jgi:hypothetical protein
VRRADNLTTFKCRLSRNLGASTFWNPVGLSGPVMGLLYLFIMKFCVDVSGQPFCYIFKVQEVREERFFLGLLDL